MGPRIAKTPADARRAFHDTRGPAAPPASAAEEFDLLFRSKGTPAAMRREIARLAALVAGVGAAGKADPRAGLRHLSITRCDSRAPERGAGNAPPGAAAAANAEAARAAAETRRFLDRLRQRDRRDIPPSLRFRVLERDRFRCTACGANPADDPRCKLHVDHVAPFSKGGRTELGNLRTLCARCNLGKGARGEAR